jgi:hypothetical protein
MGPRGDEEPPVGSRVDHAHGGRGEDEE